MGYAPVTVVSEITEVYGDHGRAKFLLIPWSVDLKYIQDSIKEVEEGLIAIGHLEIILFLKSSNIM